MTTEIISAIVAALATIIGGYLAYKGVKKTADADLLSRAAGLYSDYADKMDERVTKLEQKNIETDARLKISEKEAARYKGDAQAYRKIITEVIQWITEILDWEARGYQDPAPHFTLAMILTHLTRSMKERTPSAEDGES